MKWLSLVGQLVGAAGAVVTVFSPFVRVEPVPGSGEIVRGEARPYRHGAPPLWKQLSTWTTIGLGLVAVGFLLQAAGTFWGL